MTDNFSKAKRGPVISPDPAKQRITIRLDADIIGHFKGLVLDAGGGNHQTLINDALRKYINMDDKGLESKLRKITCEELKKAN